MLKIRVKNIESKKYVFIKYPDDSEYLINLKLDRLNINLEHFYSPRGKENFEIKAIQKDNVFDGLVALRLFGIHDIKCLTDAYRKYDQTSKDIQELILNKLRTDDQFGINRVSPKIQVEEYNALKSEHPELYGSMYSNAKEVAFQEITLFDKHVLFTTARIARTSVPETLNLYEVRSDDFQQGIICCIAKQIRVNHGGTILSRDKIKLNNCGSRDIDEDVDITFNAGACRTVDQYLEKFPLKKPIKVQVR